MLATAVLARIQTKTDAINGEVRVQATDPAQKDTGELMQYAFSEPETAAVRDFILVRCNNMALYLTLHSYRHMFVYPRRYEWQDHSDKYELGRVDG